MSDTKSKWRLRVVSWRESGQTAEDFSERQGFAASTLRWWSSQLRHDLAATPAEAPGLVRFARVVRSPAVASSVLPTRGAIVVELLDARARVVVEPGADRETLAIVLDLVEARGGR
jgi:hypothetical protein